MIKFETNGISAANLSGFKHLYKEIFKKVRVQQTAAMVEYTTECTPLVLLFIYINNISTENKSNSEIDILPTIL